MQFDKSLARLVSEAGSLITENLTYPRLPDTDMQRYLFLRHSHSEKLGDQFFPVHERIISILMTIVNSKLVEKTNILVPMETLATRVKAARTDAKLSQEGLARKVGVSQGLIGQIESGTNQGSKHLPGLARALGVSADWLETGKGSQARPEGSIQNNGVAKHFSLSPPDDDFARTEKIEYWSARGSCGGGFLNYDQMPKGHLVKEITFFERYNLKPANAFAIYADGNSMADFIVDGDIVIFDKSKTEPRSGKIFAIEHPDGLRIKQLRRDIDGSWILESKNGDKRAFPDERIGPDQAEFLKIHGEFVYRQGG